MDRVEDDKDTRFLDLTSFLDFLRFFDISFSTSFSTYFSTSLFHIIRQFCFFFPFLLNGDDVLIGRKTPFFGETNCS